MKTNEITAKVNVGWERGVVLCTLGSFEKKRSKANRGVFVDDIADIRRRDEFN